MAMMAALLYTKEKTTALRKTEATMAALRQMENMI